MPQSGPQLGSRGRENGADLPDTTRWRRFLETAAKTLEKFAQWFKSLLSWKRKERQDPAQQSQHALSDLSGDINGTNNLPSSSKINGDFQSGHSSIPFINKTPSHSVRRRRAFTSEQTTGCRSANQSHSHPSRNPLKAKSSPPELASFDQAPSSRGRDDQLQRTPDQDMQDLNGPMVDSTTSVSSDPHTSSSEHEDRHYRQRNSSPQISHDIPDITGKVTRQDKYAYFEGNYSQVFEGYLGDQKVSIKVIRTITKASKLKQRFCREVNSWWHFRHKNILQLYGYIRDEEFGGVGAMIAPWCERGNAAKFLAKKRSPSRRFSIFQDVACGLEYLHSLDPAVIHGDLKPTNVLIDESLVAKLCDFGLVRFTRGLSNKEGTGLTTTSGHTGTARYLAFELVQPEEDTPPTIFSDVWALGCLGLQILYSKPPFANIHRRANQADYRVYREITSGKPPASRPEVDGVLSKLWDVFEACWSLNPMKRPTTSEVHTFLESSGRDIVTSLKGKA